MAKVRWIMSAKHQDELADTWVSSADFNAPLRGNDPGADGGTCVAEPKAVTAEDAPYHEADEDIQAGRISTFDSIEDMIAALKQA